MSLTPLQRAERGEITATVALEMYDRMLTLLAKHHGVSIVYDSVREGDTLVHDGHYSIGLRKLPESQPKNPCKHGIAAGHCPDCPMERPWLCARVKDAEHWQWGGATQDEAINAGLELWGGDNRPDGFWIAPSHESKGEDDSDEDFTVEADKVEWIPLR